MSPSCLYPRVALVHNILPPYRVPLFNAISAANGGAFHVLLQRETHPLRRSWTVPWSDVRFDFSIMRGMSLDFPRLGLAHHVTMNVGRELSRLEPDVVVVAGWDSPASWAAQHWAIRRRRRVVAWTESTQHSGKARDRYSNGLRRHFLSRCQSLIVAGVQAEEFARTLGSRGPFFRMPNPVDSPELRRLPPPNELRRALFVGELSTRKGVDIIVGAVHELLEELSSITFVGDGPLSGDIRKLSEADSRVRALGALDAEGVIPAMANADLLLLPSRRDPWPLVSVEALVARRPMVLGPGVGSADELLSLAGSAISVMRSATETELLRCVRDAIRSRVPPSAAMAYTPQTAADSFLAACSSGSCSSGFCL